MSRRRHVLLALTLAATTSLAAAAAAPDVVVTRAKAALAAWAKRDAAGAVRALEDALAAARAAAPLEVRQAVVAQQPHKGLGLYDPVVGPIEARALNLYVEVANYAAVVLSPATTGTTATMKGAATSAPAATTASASPSSAGTPALVRATLEVRGAFSYDDVDDNGVVTRVDLGEKPLGTQTFETRATDRVTSFGLDVALGDRAPAGTYHVDLRVKDVVAGTTATRPLSFTLR